MQRSRLCGRTFEPPSPPPRASSFQAQPRASKLGNRWAVWNPMNAWLPFHGNNLDWSNGSQRWVPSWGISPFDLGALANLLGHRTSGHHFLNVKNALGDRIIYPDNQWVASPLPKDQYTRGFHGQTLRTNPLRPISRVADPRYVDGDYSTHSLLVILSASRVEVVL